MLFDTRGDRINLNAIYQLSEFIIIFITDI